MAKCAKCKLDTVEYEYIPYGKGLKRAVCMKCYNKYINKSNSK